MMREFHIISSGISLLTNAQKKGLLLKDLKIAEEDFWGKLLENPAEINRLKEFLEKDPLAHSAELNTFLRVVKDKDPSLIEVYFFGTKTKSNELCRRVIEIFLKEKGYSLYTPYEVSGYFWEAKFDEKNAVDEFQKGIVELIDRLIYLAKRKKKEGYKVYFNPTGGLKAHVIATALTAFLVDADVYYMNEEFNEVIFMPRLFYIPKGKEMRLLFKLESSDYIGEIENLTNEYAEEIERLSLYGLISFKLDNINRICKLEITEKGKLFLIKLDNRGDLI